MNELEEKLLHEETGGAEPGLRIRTGTRIDLGRWWRSSPVWLCVVGDELILLAVARRRFFARIALRDAGASRYHHSSGELVIEPGEALPLHKFKLTPADALRILDIIHTASNSLHHQPHQASC